MGMIGFSLPSFTIAPQSIDLCLVNFFDFNDLTKPIIGISAIP